MQSGSEAEIGGFRQKAAALLKERDEFNRAVIEVEAGMHQLRAQVDKRTVEYMYRKTGSAPAGTTKEQRTAVEKAVNKNTAVKTKQTRAHKGTPS